MTEQRQQNWTLPLRVRFRASAEQGAPERTTIPNTPPTGGDPLLQMPHLSSDAELLRTHQVKELLRLSALLRAELGLDEVLQQIVASISACAGFHIAIISLIEDEYVSRVAGAGAFEEGKRI